MNYLFKESTISSPVDNILFVGKYIVTHHHLTLCVYDLSLNLIRRKSFYEKIQSIKRINNFSFAILFDHGKLVQSDLCFNPLCLRIVEDMDKIDMHNNYCVVYNQYALKWFNITEEEIKDLSFSVFGIFNIKNVFFMENYIPTLLVISQSKKSWKCSVISLDGTPIIIEDYELIDNVMTAKSIEKFIIFASRNFIQIKYKRESYVINLNNNIRTDILPETLKNSVIPCSYETKEQVACIFLENPKIFVKDDLIFILDSNGELFKIQLNFDVKKIFSATISFLRRLSYPTSIDFDTHYLVIGSWLNDTVLYKFQENITNEDIENAFKICNKELLDNHGNNIEITSENVISEQNKLQIDMNCLYPIIKCSSNIWLVEQAKICNIGIIKCFEPESNNTLLITTTSGVFHGKFFIDFEIIQRSKINFKVERIFSNENGIIVVSQSNAFQLQSNLELVPFENNENIMNEKFFMNFRIFCDSSRRLIFQQNGLEVFFIENVDCWVVGVGKLIIISNGVFKIIEIPSFKTIFSTSKISDFENDFYNELFTTNDQIEQIGTISYKTTINSLIGDQILEILIVHDTNTFILFRTVKQLYIYQYFFGKLVKCFIPKHIVFGSEHQSLFCLQNIVYCRSKQPFLIIFKNGISVLPCSLKISYPVALDNVIFGFYKGNLIKTKIDIDNCVFSEKLILKPAFLFENSFQKLKETRLQSSNSAEHFVSELDSSMQHNKSGYDVSSNINISELNRKRSLTASSSDKNYGSDSILSSDHNSIKRRKMDATLSQVIEQYEEETNCPSRPSSARVENEPTITNNSKLSYSDENHIEHDISSTNSHTQLINGNTDSSFAETAHKPFNIAVDETSNREKFELEKDSQRFQTTGNNYNNDLESSKPTTEQKLFDENSLFQNQNVPIEAVNLPEEYRNDPLIKYVVIGKGCYIFVFAKYEEFVYNPFIPTVHISDPQTGKTHSEPINKEEAEYKNPFPILRARTLRFELQLRSTDFKIMSTLTLEPNEFVCDIKTMLNDNLVICTSFPEGEDKKTKGKLTVYSIADIVIDPENPHISKKLKFISSETFKDACLFAVEIRSLIAVCVGTKLMIYEFNVNSGLCVTGVNEVSLLSTCLYSTKNFLAISDVFNGIFFFFLRPRDPLKLHLLGKSVPILDCRFLLGIDFDSLQDKNTQLSLVAFDRNGTIHVFSYSPEHNGFTNSNLLIKRAEVVTKACYPLRYSYAGKISNYEALYFSCNFMTTIMAISVPRIQILQHYIAMSINNSCGINPRNYLESTEYLNIECKSSICERILLEFFYFKPSIQENICFLMNSSYNDIVNMIEMCLTHHKQFQ